ncbi:MAG: acyltransferase family protein, partial [Gemmatimonadetes bacterium]|nr:acyltransferase family protein [Gemmatimonadota bacterium]
DLDALRGFAMLLGIALHAGLSFTPLFWPIQDTQQNELFGLFCAAIHGFRMPLFFLLSGFFTAMLWRQRGLKSLLSHRLRRVLLPLLLGLITVVPAVSFISGIALTSGTGLDEAETAKNDIWTAAAAGQLDEIKQCLANGADLDALDSAFGTTPLAWAALHGQTAAAELLLQQGAEVNRQTRDGGTALHAAAFLGRTETAALLIEHGADAQIRNTSGMTPRQSSAVDWELTLYILALLKIEFDEDEAKAGRLEIADLLGGIENQGANSAASLSDRLVQITSMPIFSSPVFHHLWFLWFLCWLVVAFTAYAAIADRLEWQGPHKWLVLSPVRFLWLIPLSMVPQWFMGLTMPGFGPDTSIGILPIPQVLLYYAIFFGFGALYFDCDDRQATLGKSWRWMLPLGLFVVFPLGLEFSLGSFGFREALLPPSMTRPFAVALQVLYAWIMAFACMGLFRTFFVGENKSIRYMSDASYWLYVVHLPLVMGAQWAVRTWPLWPIVKFTLICLLVTGFLLLTYQTIVRYSWLGKLLNGPRARPE